MNVGGGAAGIKNPGLYQKQKRDDSRMSERFASYERAHVKVQKILDIFAFESARTDKIVSFEAIYLFTWNPRLY